MKTGSLTQSIVSPNASWIEMEVFRDGMAGQNWCVRQQSLNKEELSLVLCVSWMFPAKAQRALCNSSVGSGLPNSGLCFLTWQAISRSCRNPTRCMASLASHSLTESLSSSSSCCCSELREAWTCDVIAVLQTMMEVVFEFWFPRTQVR